MSARLTDQQRRDRALSEDEFRAQVNDVAEMLGWKWMWVHPLRAAGGIWKTPTFGPLGKGWPDTIYAKGGEFPKTLFVEFKRELAKVEPDQERVLEVLRGLEVHHNNGEYAATRVYVWRPSMLEGIVEILRGDVSYTQHQLEAMR